MSSLESSSNTPTKSSSLLGSGSASMLLILSSTALMVAASGTFLERFVARSLPGLVPAGRLAPAKLHGHTSVYQHFVPKVLSTYHAFSSTVVYD